MTRILLSYHHISLNHRPPPNISASVALFTHFLILAPFVHPQPSPSVVGEPCSLDTDCVFLEQTSDQIGCGIDNMCGGKGAVCYYDGTCYRYTQVCVSRESVLPIFR